MARDKYPKQSLGASLYGAVKESQILMVGAGGIGCELLKNLVLTGFGEIHVVDLDTIDLSNLNRQFLFRHEHIKKSKALVARDSAGAFNPNVKIEAHHANIKDNKFNVEWFKKFNLVFNALDNLEARQHVNRMCLAADVPLIDSGTAGFNGNVKVIKKGVTECYDCVTPDPPKSFPICTIRSTPSKPIHCIVWAKSYLFTEIFGTSELDAPDLDHSEDAENRLEIESLKAETAALNMIRDSMHSEEFPRLVFNKVFKSDIERLASLEDMWKSRSKPNPLDFDELTQQFVGDASVVARQDQQKWSPAQNLAVFIDSLNRLSGRVETLKLSAGKKASSPALEFDKDDDDTLDFVAAAANLRSLIFGIDFTSKFDIKQMAGNIIPAIATTNAMAAGLCVMQAFKVLRNNLDKTRTIYLTNSIDRIITSETPRPPNPSCERCGIAQSRLEVDIARATLNDLVEDLLQLQLGYSSELAVQSEEGTLYDPDMEDNLPKKLKQLGVKNDSFVTVIDEQDESPRVNLVLSISEKSLPKDSKPLKLAEHISIARKPKSAASQDASNNSSFVNGNSDATKRKRDADEAGLEEDQSRKKGKLAEPSEASNGTAIFVDDTSDGAIVIDD